MRLLVTFILVFVVAGCGSNNDDGEKNQNKERYQVDAGKYVTVQFDDYSKIATSVVYFDYDKMITENLKVFGLSEK